VQEFPHEEVGRKAFTAKRLQLSIVRDRGHAITFVTRECSSYAEGFPFANF
jgi:uncharacterized Ntn-hydrolase superfamily protein